MDHLRPCCMLKGHTNWVYSLAFAPDGKTLASAGWDRVIRLWDIEAGAEANTLRGHLSEVYCLAFSPAGDQLAAGSATGDSPLRIWNVAEGKYQILDGHSNVVHGVAWSSDGRLLASGGYDRSVRVWNAATGTEQALLSGHARAVYGVAFQKGDATVISVDSSTVAKQWDVAASAELAALPPPERSAHCVAFSPDATIVATGYGSRNEATGESIGEATVWDAATGSARAKLPGHSNWVYSLAFSPDGRWLATGGWDGGVRLWDWAAQTPMATVGGHDDIVLAVAVSPDGTKLASAGHDQVVRVWTIEL